MFLTSCWRRSPKDKSKWSRRRVPTFYAVSCSSSTFSGNKLQSHCQLRISTLRYRGVVIYKNFSCYCSLSLIVWENWMKIFHDIWSILYHVLLTNLAPTHIMFYTAVTQIVQNWLAVTMASKECCVSCEKELLIMNWYCVSRSSCVALRCASIRSCTASYWTMRRVSVKV